MSLGVIVHVGGWLAAGWARPVRPLARPTVVTYESALTASHDNLHNGSEQNGSITVATPATGHQPLWA